MSTKSLASQRIDFTKKFYQWKHWFYTEFQPAHKDAEIAYDEVRIIHLRKVWLNNKKVKLLDAEHGDLSRGFVSRHHDGCAADIVLYIWDNERKKLKYISDGSHPYWIEMAGKAKEFGLISGIDFGDTNHFSTESPDGRK